MFDKNHLEYGFNLLLKRVSQSLTACHSVCFAFYIISFVGWRLVIYAYYDEIYPVGTIWPHFFTIGLLMLENLYVGSLFYTFHLEKSRAEKMTVSRKLVYWLTFILISPPLLFTDFATLTSRTLVGIPGARFRAISFLLYHCEFMILMLVILLTSAIYTIYFLLSKTPELNLFSCVAPSIHLMMGVLLSGQVLPFFFHEINQIDGAEATIAWNKGDYIEIVKLTLNYYCSVCN